MSTFGSVLTDQTLSNDIKVNFALAHVGALLNDHRTLNFDVARAFLLQTNALVDAVGPLKAQAWNTALATISVLEEALVSSVLIDVSHDIVEDNDHQVEVVGKSLELLAWDYLGQV